MINKHVLSMPQGQKLMSIFKSTASCCNFMQCGQPFSPKVLLVPRRAPQNRLLKIGLWSKCCFHPSSKRKCPYLFYHLLSGLLKMKEKKYSKYCFWEGLCCGEDERNLIPRGRGKTLKGIKLNLCEVQNQIDICKLVLR